MKQIRFGILLIGLAALFAVGMVVGPPVQAQEACDWDDEDCMNRAMAVTPSKDAPSEPTQNQSTAKGAQAEDSNFRIINQPIPQVKGPKRTVAVGKFDAIGSFKSQYGGWDVGGGLSAMLVRALKESDRFIVLERANISQVLSEQQMKGQKLVHQGSGPQLGKLIGVHFMIYGSVTEFGPQDSGGGFSIGGSGGFGGLLGGALSSQSTEGSVAMDIRIVDTTTSEILETYTVRETIKGQSWDVGITVKQFSAGGNQFMKTPLGQVTRRALNRAVQLIARKANDIPWSGQVVAFEKGELYINAGSKTGVKVGNRFNVERIISTFTDPATGKVIGQRKRAIGNVQLTGVEPEMAYGKYQPMSDDRPQRGDLVTMGN